MSGIPGIPRLQVGEDVNEAVKRVTLIAERTAGSHLRRSDALIG